MAISFAQSERSTLGVEWELQLIDVDSEDLRQCAGAILSEISTTLSSTVRCCETRSSWSRANKPE